MQEGLRCCPIPCCTCSISPCQAHSLDTCCVLHIQGIEGRRRTALVPITSTMPFYNQIWHCCKWQIILLWIQTPEWKERFWHQVFSGQCKQQLLSHPFWFLSTECPGFLFNYYVPKAHFTSSLFLPDQIFWSLPNPFPLTIHPWIRQHEFGKINYFVKRSLFFWLWA